MKKRKISARIATDFFNKKIKLTKNCRVNYEN